MDDFNNIYNEIIKQNRNNEAVFKSRFKKKYKDFLDGKNKDLLCKVINYISLKKLNTNKEPIIDAKPIDSVSIEEKDKIILNLRKENAKLLKEKNIF